MSHYQPSDLILVMSDTDNQLHRRVIRCCPLEAWHRSGGCSDDQRRVLGALQADLLACLPAGRDESLEAVDGGRRCVIPRQAQREKAMARLDYAYAALAALGVHRRSRAWALLRAVLAEGHALGAAGRLVRVSKNRVAPLLRSCAELLLAEHAYERERQQVSVWAMGR